jgi:hypothetical protein
MMPWCERGQTQSHQVSVTGGGENFSYYGALTGRDRGRDPAQRRGVGLLGAPEPDRGAPERRDPPPDLRVHPPLGPAHTRREQHPRATRSTVSWADPPASSGGDGTLTAIEAFQNGNRFTGWLTAEHQIIESLSHRLTFGADIFNSDEFQLFPFGAISNMIGGFPEQLPPPEPEPERGLRRDAPRPAHRRHPFHDLGGLPVLRSR